MTFNQSNLNKGGIGLGLYISKLIIQRIGPHDQEFLIESEVSKGTTFSFFIFQNVQAHLENSLQENVFMHSSYEQVSNKHFTEYTRISQNQCDLDNTFEEKHYLAMKNEQFAKVLGQKLTFNTFQSSNNNNNNKEWRHANSVDLT